jgi:hypothetical protein
MDMLILFAIVTVFATYTYSIKSHIPQIYINNRSDFEKSQVWWYTPVTLVLRRQKRSILNLRPAWAI